MDKHCIICGCTITHHHKYCEKHYPQKSATILSLKNEMTKLKKELSKKDNQILALKKVNKQLKKEKIKNANTQNNI